MKKIGKFISFVVILSMVLTLFSFSPLVNAQLTQEQKNERTTVAPKDGSGMYIISFRWNGDEVGFSDETLIEDSSSDDYISRVSRSPSLESSALSYMMATTWGGSTDGTAPSVDFKDGNVYYEFDFGITSKVTAVNFWHNYTNAWIRENYPQDINKLLPKHLKLQWSNDKIHWEEKSFIVDYTDPDHPLHQAYLDVVANGTANGSQEMFKDPWMLELDSPARARYFRLVNIVPNQVFTEPEDPNSTERSIWNIYGLDFYDTSEPDWVGDGAGTEESPYLIGTADEMTAFGEYIQTDRVVTADKYFKLTADIDMGGLEWTPLGLKRPFEGSFDGNGHIISNISIGTQNNPVSEQYAGFFGSLASSAIVSNLGLENVQLYGNYGTAPRYGAFVGLNNGEIRSCYVSDVIVVNSAMGVGGGFVGMNFGRIYNCYVGGGYDVQTTRTGGFVGDNVNDGGNSYGYIYNSYITNGIPESFAGQYKNDTIVNCYHMTSEENGPAQYRTAEQFADGSVKDELNNGITSIGNEWAQNEGEAFPHLTVFDTGSASFVPEFTVRNINYGERELVGTYYDDGGCWNVANVFDNDINTMNNDWSVRSITVDLGEGVYGSVSKISYRSPNDGNWWFADQMMGALLQGSNDNAVYETIAVVESSPINAWTTIELDQPTLGYRYLRWTAAEGKVIPLSELHWYGQTNFTISDYNTHLTLNSRYTVKNSYDEPKTAVNYLARYSADGYLLEKVTSAVKEYTAKTAAEVTVNSIDIPKDGMDFIAKSLIWQQLGNEPMANALAFYYDAALYMPKSEFALPNYYVDNMVMQRNKPLKIGGKALPGITVNVSLDKGNETVSNIAAADEDGSWTVTLPAQEKGGPYKLTVSSVNQTTVVNNVYIGEVFLCAGQSNMEFNWNNWGNIQDKSFSSEFEANDRIKFLIGNQQINAPGEKFDLSMPESMGWGKVTGWAVCDGNNVKGLSEIGYKVAKELAEAESDLHVGVIAVAVGGAPIDPYMVGGTYYNNLILPFLDYSLGAILWYQGESDTPGIMNVNYEEKMTKLINDWRDAFGEDDLPFLYVQLARHSHWWTTPYMWDVQRRVLTSPLLDNPNNVDMVVTIDTDGGTGAHPDQNTAIHPAGKAIVGERMANLYKKYVWGETDLVTSGPMFKSAEVSGSSIIVTFDNTEDGLVIKDTDNTILVNETSDNSDYLGLNTVCEFEITDANDSSNTFVPATAEIISENQVKVYAEGIDNPKYVRYAMTSAYPKNPSLANTYTENGTVKNLPASPFSTLAIQY